MTELPPVFSLARPEQDGKLLHAIVWCDDRTIVDSLEGLLTQLPLRQLEKDMPMSSSHDPQMVATDTVGNVA